MEITFKNSRLQKRFMSEKTLVKHYGAEMAKKISERMFALRKAETLAEFLPPYSGRGRCHELKGNRKGQFSMDLKHPYRLIFAPAGSSAGGKGEWEWAAVTAINILGIEDPHD